MSKKTRKKSPKTPSRTAAKPAAKRPPAGVGRTVAKTPAKKSVTKPATASHKAASKKLKVTAPQKSAAPTTAGLQPTATKPATEHPSIEKLPAPPAAAVPGKAAALKEGFKAPAFQLPRDGGNGISLADYSGRKLVIFFYPRADTPGCTKEAIDFTRLSGAFADSQTAVLGVSADPLKAQEAFRDKHQLSFPLVSDEQHEMLEAYGVWGEKSMYGKTFLGIVRTTVLIGADGRVAKIWRNVKVDGHADEVLAAAQAL
ncbi:redoxin domain-containing protein [uncultured Bradyrhizobium sp.]|uniref:peroxiredoxin n=1 Tax=uncultured Bradyrhizobium sp. TaxID=199684 RepID=UPI0035CB8098